MRHRRIPVHIRANPGQTLRILPLVGDANFFDAASALAVFLFDTHTEQTGCNVPADKRETTG
jgi:hypothetical protein